MLGLNSCTSKPKKESKETINVYFPSFPEAPEGLILPLDIYGNKVTDAGEVVNIAMPYWYWKQIIDYVVKTEEAVQALQNY